MRRTAGETIDVYRKLTVQARADALAANLAAQNLEAVTHLIQADMSPLPASTEADAPADGLGEPAVPFQAIFLTFRTLTDPKEDPAQLKQLGRLVFDELKMASGTQQPSADEASDSAYLADNVIKALHQQHWQSYEPFVERSALPDGEVIALSEDAVLSEMQSTRPSNSALQADFFGQVEGLTQQLAVTYAKLRKPEQNDARVLQVVEQHNEFGVRVLVAAGVQQTGLLIKAAELGFVDIVERLLTTHQNIDEVLSEEVPMSALVTAVAHGQTVIVQRLLAAGADPYLQLPEGLTAFDYAAVNAKVGIELLDIIVAHQSPTESAVWAAVTKAMSSFRPAALPYLLELKADFSQRVENPTADKKILASLAFSSDLCEFADRLLPYLGDLNASIARLDAHQRTPLMVAATNNNVAGVRAFLKHGATVDAQTDRGHTALTIAAREGSKEIVDILLQHDSNPNHQTIEGQHFALYLAAANGHEDIVQALLDAKADTTQTTQDGSTALMGAAKYDKLGTLQLLLNVPELTAAALQAALQMARDRGHSRVIQFIEASEQYKQLVMGEQPLASDESDSEENAPDESVDALDQMGYTNLMLAAINGELTIVQDLLQRGADLSLYSMPEQYFALYFAAINGHTNVVRALLDAGADTTQMTQDGNTALMGAVKHGQLGPLKLLLKVPELTDEALMAALQVARVHGRNEISKLITSSPRYQQLLLSAQRRAQSDSDEPAVRERSTVQQSSSVEPPPSQPPVADPHRGQPGVPRSTAGLFSSVPALMRRVSPAMSVFLKLMMAAQKAVEEYETDNPVRGVRHHHGLVGKARGSKLKTALDDLSRSSQAEASHVMRLMKLIDDCVRETNWRGKKPGRAKSSLNTELMQALKTSFSLNVPLEFTSKGGRLPGDTGDKVMRALLKAVNDQLPPDQKVRLEGLSPQADEGQEGVSRPSPGANKGGSE